MKDGLLFLLIVLVEAGIFCYLVLDRRIPGGHDGFQYFTLQYYFLNNVAYAGEVPQWIPFLTHGTVTAWWYGIQSGLLQNVLFFAAGVLRGVNFLPLFYAGLFVDELLLLIGTWLLGKRFLGSPLTVLFVTLSVTGSCIWTLQPWWNLHFYYALPLIIFLCHRFLDSGKWRYCLLAGNLLFIQSLGNLPYFLPATTLVVFLYFLFYAACNSKAVRQKISMINLGWPAVGSFLLIILPFVAYYVALTFGADQIVNYTFRKPGGSSSLDVFLGYGGQLHWRAWAELLSGVSPLMDQTLYIGIVCVPLIVWGLIFNVKRENIHFHLTAVVLLLLSMATVVSIFFYYCWPMMGYFRHLALLSPLVKLFLCFLAGFGVDVMFCTPACQTRPLLRGALLMVLALLMLGAFFALRWLANDYPNNYEILVKLIQTQTPQYIAFFRELFNDSVIVKLLNRAAFFALAAAVFFAVFSFFNRKKYLLPLLLLLLGLHGADIYGFKLSEIRLKTLALTEKSAGLTAFEPMPYRTRRGGDLQKDNHRAEQFDALPMRCGSLYWTIHAFLFQDALGSPFRIDNLLLPLNTYMKVYWGQPLHGPSGKPLGHFDYSHMAFPPSRPALKISGKTADKIQIFSQARIVSSEEKIAALITNYAYTGNTIFLSPRKEDNRIDDRLPAASKKDLLADTRMPLPYEVTQFDSNNIKIDLFVPETEDAWLLYSDVWHPLWRATVNGKEVPVYKANLAYKAVRLDKGDNEIHFYFKSGLVSFLYFFFSADALIWLLIIVFLAAWIMTGRSAWGRSHDPADIL